MPVFTDIEDLRQAALSGIRDVRDANRSHVLPPSQW